jgi:glycosyltransferase involved in cell wall biosynthesis
VPEKPELAVVVLSYRNEASVAEAVDSLLAQNLPLEIVVSHSGGGPTPQLLRDRDDVRVLPAEQRRLPGAARNAGVAATNAPVVAFLEADCVATPGWASGRLRRHLDGAEAVASALLPRDGCACSRAVWLAEHSARLPVPDSVNGSLHGASYTRQTLERHGPFPDHRVGEDTDLNRRLELEGIAITWAPEVVSLHRYPTSVRGLLRDGFARGERRAHRRRGDLGVRLLVRDAIAGALAGVRRARLPAAPVSGPELARALPLIAAFAVSKVAGTLRGSLR